MRSRTSPLRAYVSDAQRKAVHASKAEKSSPAKGKISPSCKAAAKRKFKVWPSAYGAGWGVRCTKAGGPGNMGKGKKKK